MKVVLFFWRILESVVLNLDLLVIDGSDVLRGAFEHNSNDIYKLR